MPSPDSITVAQLSRLIGIPDAPVIIDVRIAPDRALDPRTLPGSIDHDFRTVRDWASVFAGKPVVVSCQRGQTLRQGVAAWLRHACSCLSHRPKSPTWLTASARLPSMWRAFSGVTRGYQCR
jgi:rhodanese-related sulfurtransferase